MRAVFTCIQGYGHFHPMVPLAAALRRAGHEVAFSTAERFCPRIEQAGFPAFPSGWDLGLVYEQTLRLPDAVAAQPDPWAFGAHMFAGVAAPAKAPELTEVVLTWSADVVVHDATDFAGPIAAAANGIPYASHSFGALPPERFSTLAGDLAAPAWRSAEMEPEPLGGMFRHLYLDICPPSFQAGHIEEVPVARRLRPVPFDEIPGSGLPRWLPTLPPRPTVYATMGTVHNDSPVVFEAILAGLGDEPINLIVTVGHNRDPADLGPRPPNVHVERYIPQSLLFPSCDVVVTHGGSGTTLAALAHGLPLLVLPQGANQFWNAERCVELGVGSRLQPAEVTPEAVRQQVRVLLEDPEYRRRAGWIQHEIEQMPAPESTVALVEQLARDGRLVTAP